MCADWRVLYILLYVTPTYSMRTRSIRTRCPYFKNLRSSSVGTSWLGYCSSEGSTAEGEPCREGVWVSGVCRDMRMQIGACS